MLKGLPASGKSTYARSLVDQGGWKRVNKDDLRKLIDNGRWSGKREKFILEVRDNIIEKSLERGLNVVVDDTNLVPKHETRLKQLADNHGAEFSVKFFDIDVQEAIKRDLNREGSVGADVIKKMYRDYIMVKPENQRVEWLEDTVICDIDGTLAKMVSRHPFEWEKVDQDDLVRPVADLINDLFNISKTRIILVTGRDGSALKKTKQWLFDKKVNYDFIFSREEGDTRPDYEVKKEIYDKNIKDRYNIRFVIDDRPQVVRMWRELGLFVMDVGDGIEF